MTMTSMHHEWEKSESQPIKLPQTVYAANLVCEYWALRFIQYIVYLLYVITDIRHYMNWQNNASNGFERRWLSYTPSLSLSLSLGLSFYFHPKCHFWSGHIIRILINNIGLVYRFSVTMMMVTVMGMMAGSDEVT